MPAGAPEVTGLYTTSLVTRPKPRTRQVRIMQPEAHYGMTCNAIQVITEATS